MKIGINGRFLMKPFTGIGQYTIEILKRLDDKNDYLVIVPEKLPRNLGGLFGKNVRFVVLPERKLPSAGMRKTWWEQVQVAEELVKQKVDKAFFPYPGQPWTADFYRKVPAVVTVHDCIPWMDRRYRRGILSRFYHLQSKRSLVFAEKIVTVSEESKKDLMTVCGLEARKIEVIYNGVSEIFGTRAEVSIEKLGLKKSGYYLYVGGYDARKNVPLMLSEFERAKSEYSLVLAGGKVVESGLYRSFDQAKDVVKTGFLTADELNCLYQNARALINLSQAEGFNLPVLEAAKCGTPLIISDIAVHREIYGDGAIYVDTEKVGALSKALNKLEDDREKWRKKASEVAKNYSFQKASKKTEDVLNS